MTKQEIFDRVARHLIKQGRQSRRSTGCAYRGNEGTRCAVGCLIPDRLYSPIIEEAGVPADIEDYQWSRLEWNVTALVQILVEIGVHPEEWRLLRRLQHIHDGGPPREWPTCLRSLAREFSLSPAVLGVAP